MKQELQGFKLNPDTVHLVGLYKREVVDSACNRIGGSGPGVAPVPIIDWVLQIRSELRQNTTRGSYLTKTYKMKNTEGHVKLFLDALGLKYPDLLIKQAGEQEATYLSRVWTKITKGFSKTIYLTVNPKS